MEKKRHIKNFKSFLNENYKISSEEEKIEEGLFSRLKDSLIMAISKKIGGANKIDKQTAAYFEQMKGFYDKKTALEVELTKSKEAFEENPSDMALKKAYELKQKAVEGQQTALINQENALKKLLDSNIKKIVGKDNPRLSMYADSARAQVDFELSNYAFSKYEKMGVTGDKMKELEEEKKLKEAEMKQKQEALKAEMKMKKEAEKEAEKDSGAELSLKDLKVGQSYMYKNSKGQDIKVKIVDLFKNDKVEGQNGTMVKVKSEKTGGEFRVKITALTPIGSERVKKDKEGNIVDKTEVPEKEPQAAA